MKNLFPALLLLMTLLSLGACTKAPSPQAVSSANLTDYTIKDREGNSIGMVRDVILNLESGQIRYVIMELPPDISSFNKAAFVPSSANQTAVPWEVLQVEAGATGLILTVEDKMVFAAPRLPADLDDLADNWDADFQAYWQANLK